MAFRSGIVRSRRVGVAGVGPYFIVITIIDIERSSAKVRALVGTGQIGCRRLRQSWAGA
jgi:hypothetical protein